MENFADKIKNAIQENQAHKAPDENPAIKHTESSVAPTQEEAPVEEGVESDESYEAESVEESYEETAEERQERLLRAIIDGKEVEVPEEEAVAAYQKVKAADKRFQEAARLRKEADAERKSLLQRLKKNPAEVLAELGHDVDALAEQYVVDKYQEPLMTPEEREAYRKEKELEELRRKEQDRQEQEKKAAYQKQVEQAAMDWSKRVDMALKDSPVPKTPYMAKRVIDVLIAANDNGREMTPEEAVGVVWNGFQKELNTLTEVLESDKLVDFLGKKSIDKIRKHLLGKVKNPVKRGKSTNAKSKQRSNNQVPTLDELIRRARGF